MAYKVFALSFFLIGMFSNCIFAQGDKILGEWYTAEKKAKVQIYKANGKYHGKILSLKEPIDPDTKKPKTDKNNPDPKKRNNPLIGMNIIKDFEYKDGYWQNGTIYDPENGKEYSCYIEVYDAKTLKVRGYIGFSLIGRTTYWTKD